MENLEPRRMMKPEIKSLWMYPLVLLLLAAGIGFITVNNTHDWGDDFAQYLVQARVMAGIEPSGVQCTETYSPQVRGPLFSVLLVPAVLSEHPLAMGKCLVLAFVWVLSVICFFVFRSFIGSLCSFLLSTFIIIHYPFVGLYNQILTDIPFTSTVLASLALMGSKSRRMVRIGILLASIAWGFRDAGIALIPVVLWICYQNRSGIADLCRDLSFYTVPIIVISCITWLTLDQLWPGTWYAGTTFAENSTVAPWDRLLAYKTAFLRLFEFEIPVWMNPVFGNIILYGGIAGLALRWIRNKDAGVLFVLLYLILLLIYPYANDPVRLLFPVLPVWLFASAYGIITLTGMFTERHKVLFPALLLSMLVLANFRHYPINLKPETGITGPDAADMFTFIEDSIPADDLIACEKPWALNWMTSRKTIPLTCMSLQPDHFVVSTKTNSIPDSYRKVFENTTWSVYAVR